MVITLPYDPSPNIYKGRPDPIQCIVVHSVECPLAPGYAKTLAGPAWFASTKAQTSAHAIFGPDGGVEMVKPGNVAWAVGTANQWTYNIEHCGYARFTRAEWLTPSGRDELTYSGLWAAQIALANGIPARRLSHAEMSAGKKGFVTHNDCRIVWGGTTHTDPGDGWPWDFYLATVESGMNTAKGNAAGKPGKIANTYTVQSGDTLGAIAKKHGTTVAKLAALNGIANPDDIAIGQVLRLTGAETQEEEEDDMAKNVVYIARHGGGLVVIDFEMKSKVAFSDAASLKAFMTAHKRNGGIVDTHLGVSAKQVSSIPWSKG